MNNGKICVSVAAETVDETIANIKRAEEFADVIEVRFDSLDPAQVDKCRAVIANLKFQRPLLATYRSPEQGGNSSASLEQRIAFWQEDHQGFWAADVEEDVLDSAKKWPTRIISCHDFDGVPDDLATMIERLTSSDADIVKIAIQVDDIADALPVWSLITRSKVKNRVGIPIAMGQAGRWTRILGLAYGAFMTYASLDAGKETADGQITAKDLIEIYRVRELDQHTKVYGVIGNPVSESLSPFIHNPAFVAAGVNAVFIPLLVKHLDEFMHRMVNLKTREVELNFGGFSVTMPHKQAVIKYLDEIDPTAKKIGAANTLLIEDGKLIGYNTDAHGFITPLKEIFGDLNDARVAVFGAGGAARACVYALKKENADVTVFAQDGQKANLLADEFGVEWSGISKIKDQKSKVLSDDFDIVVNATPLGMKGPLENESLFSADELEGVKFVYDLVTKAADTPLIREAKKAGIPAIGGLEMLVAQGAKQFEIWTGQVAPVDKMKEAVLARIKQI